MSKSLVKHTSNGNRDDNRASNQRECDQVYQGIKQWKAHDGAVLLPVVRKNTVALLEEKAKPRWWKVKKSAKSAICITTTQNLQREIHSFSGDEQIHELFLLISRQINLQEVKFHIPSTIDNLYIIRCGKPSHTKRPRSSDGNNNNTNKLILNGASTFCNVRMDEWQSKRVGDHNLILGPDVVIRLSMGIPWTARDALAVISKQQREDVCKQFRDMCEAKYQDHPEWDKWKGPVGKLLDVAAGSTSLAKVVECYAGGVVVQAATKLTESGLDGAFRISAGLLCLSGPGQMALAGVGVAAAIYFVPWDTIWSWFRDAFGAWLTWLARAWENFKTWVQNSAPTKGKSGKQASELRFQPMLH